MNKNIGIYQSQQQRPPVQQQQRAPVQQQQRAPVQQQQRPPSQPQNIILPSRPHSVPLPQHTQHVRKNTYRGIGMGGVR